MNTQPAEQATTSAVSLAPLVLTPPETVTSVVPAQTAGMVKLPEAIREQVDAQLEGFLHTLRTADVTSDDFRTRLDQAFAVGRKEIADATTLTNTFTSRNFVGEVDSPAYKAISEMRELFDELNPAKQGDLFGAKKVFGISIPFTDKLTGYLRRYESADKQMAAILEHIVTAKAEVGQVVSEVGNIQVKLWGALEKLEAAVYFINRLDERLSADIESVRTTEPERARALEQEVLYYVRQNQGDVIATQALTINGYRVAGVQKKTGREVMNGCDRVATIGMAALSIGVTFARSTGVEIKTMEMLQGAKQSIEGLITATGTALQEHVKATVEFASNPILGVETLQGMFDQTNQALDTFDEFRSAALSTMGTNNQMVRAQLQAQMSRIRVDRDAAAGNLPAPAALSGIAL